LILDFYFGLTFQFDNIFIFSCFNFWLFIDLPSFNINLSSFFEHYNNFYTIFLINLILRIFARLMHFCFLWWLITYFFLIPDYFNSFWMCIIYLQFNFESNYYNWALQLLWIIHIYLESHWILYVTFTVFLCWEWFKEECLDFFV